MRNIRVLFVVGLSVAGVAWASPAFAKNVVVFDDGAFVDTSSPPPGDESNEIQATLSALGHTVTTFSGTAAATWSAALTGQDALVIPELENGNLAAALPAATVTVIQGFVSAGGHLIVAGESGTNDTSFLNAVLGSSITDGSTAPGTSTKTAAAVGTRFETGPATLPQNNATSSLTTASLPAGAVSLYAAGTDSTVVLVTSGAGDVVFLGWDWFDAVPSSGVQDGGWRAALSLAIEPPDTTPPTIDCSVIRRTVWGPTNGLIEVGLKLGVRDDRDTSPLVFVTVWSDEPNGTGPYSPDAFLIGPSWEELTLKLRSERSVAPGANGRVYLLHILAIDDAGNAATECCSIVVPRMLTTSSIKMVQEEGLEAEGFCHQNGTAPPGYVPLTAVQGD